MNHTFPVYSVFAVVEDFFSVEDWSLKLCA